MSTSGHNIAHLTPVPPSHAYMNPLSINKTQSPGYHIQPQFLDEEIGEACAGEVGVDVGLGGGRCFPMFWDLRESHILRSQTLCAKPFYNFNTSGPGQKMSARRMPRKGVEYIRLLNRTGALIQRDNLPRGYVPDLR